MQQEQLLGRAVAEQIDFPRSAPSFSPRHRWRQMRSKRYGIWATIAASIMAACVPLPHATALDSPLSEDYGIIQGSSISQLDNLISADRVIAGTATNSAAEANPYEIVNRWQDKDGNNIVLRRKVRDKIANKHGLSVRTVQKVTQYAPRIDKVAETKNYFLPMDHIQCRGFGPFKRCRKVGSQDIKVAVDFKLNAKYNDPWGVATAYCVGTDGRCPDWILNAPQLQ